MTAEPVFPSPYYLPVWALGRLIYLANNAVFRTNCFVLPLLTCVVSAYRFRVIINDFIRVYASLFNAKKLCFVLNPAKLLVAFPVLAINITVVDVVLVVISYLKAAGLC